MEHVRLGRTGLKVSRLCLGTMTFGAQCDEAQSAAILDHALEHDITFLDTADMYPGAGDLSTGGATEEIIGRWMKAKRDDVVLATKGFAPTGPRPWDMGNSRKHLMAALEDSLRRLQTDYVDLYQVHFDDRSTPIDETLSTLDDMVRMGKVRYVGCSNYSAWRLAKALGRSDVLGLVRYVCVQPRYNLIFRSFERDLFPLCEEEGVAVIPYNPLAGGLLTGKHDRAASPSGATRFGFGTAAERYQDRYWHDREFDAVEALRPMAAESGRTMAELAVGWTLAQPAVTAPIVGATRPEQLDDSLRAESSPLDDDLLARLDALTVEFRLSEHNR